MRSLIEKSLCVKIEPAVTAALLNTYQKMVAERQVGGNGECLTLAGKFVEHTLRAIEYIRTGVAPSEIKHPSDTIKVVEKDKSLPDSIRVLVPRIAHAMVYEIRSKRGAVHVKEIDPQEIDASLCVQAASWIIAELVRLYHSDDEGAVSAAMTSLMRSEMPFVELIAGESVVTAKVSCTIELLLLIARSSVGVDRNSLGFSSKYGSSTVSKALQRLAADRLVHKAADGRFHVTGPGEKHLSKAVSEIGSKGRG